MLAPNRSLYLLVTLEGRLRNSKDSYEFETLTVTKKVICGRHASE